MSEHSAPDEDGGIDDRHRLSMTILMTPDMSNFAGNVHGGTLLKYLDQVAYTCATRYAELASAAEELLDPDDPLRLQLCTHSRGYVLQYDACRGSVDHATYRRIVDDLDRLVGLARAGRYLEPQLVEHLQIVLVGLGT